MPSPAATPAPAPASGSELMSFQASLCIVGLAAAVFALGYLTAPRPKWQDLRLRKGRLFSLLASLAGVYFVVFGNACDPEAFIEEFSKPQQLLFAIAAGHWAIAILEEWQCGMPGKSIERLASGCVPDSLHIMPRLQLYHHVVVTGLYLTLLYWRRCSGLGCFCLLFELPSAVVLHREMAQRLSPVPAWLRSRTDVQRHWKRCFLLFGLGRIYPCYLYFYSLLEHRSAAKLFSSAEALLFHAVALLSCGYTFLSFRMLQASSTADLQAAMVEGAAEEEFKPAGSDSDSDDDGEVGGSKPNASLHQSCSDPDAAPLREVSPEALAAMAGQSPGQPTWIAVEGIVYDVTKFLQDCPCGEQTLRKWAGKVATAAFQEAKHSDRAKEKMLRYMVGPIRYPHTEYRLMEHEEEEETMTSMLTFVAIPLAGCLVADTVLAWTQVPAPSSGESPASSSSSSATVEELLALSNLAAIGVAACSLLLRLVVKRPSVAAAAAVGRNAAGSGSGWLPVVMDVWIASLLLCCRSDKDSPVLPSRLQLAGLLLCLLEERLQTSRQVVRSSQFYLPLVLVLLSWWLRLSNSIPEVEGASRWQRNSAILSHLMQSGASHMAPALILALSTAFLVRQAPWSRQRDGSSGVVLKKEWIAMACDRTFQMSAVYAAIDGAIMIFHNPELPTTLMANAQSWILPLLLSAATCLGFLAALLLLASRSSPAFASRCVAFAVALFGVFLEWPGGYSWLLLAGVVGHLAALASRNRSRLRDAAATERFSSLPSHIIGAQAVWDRFRIAVGSGLWKVIVLQWRDVINSALPRELRVFATDDTFPNLMGSGFEDTYLGVAAHFAPQKVRSRQKLPRYCVCNVGQINSNALPDMQQTMNTLIDVWHEFQQPDMKGLISNLVAVFPDIEDQHAAKEINLSFWESSKDAHNWYVRSPGHKNALFQHTSGQLKTFGNLLASLEPSAPLRHRDRCRRCSRPVQSQEPGSLAPANCGVCGGPAYRHPVF